MNCIQYKRHIYIYLSKINDRFNTLQNRIPAVHTQLYVMSSKMCMVFLCISHHRFLFCTILFLNGQFHSMCAWFVFDHACMPFHTMGYLYVEHASTMRILKCAQYLYCSVFGVYRHFSCQKKKWLASPNRLKLSAVYPLFFYSVLLLFLIAFISNGRGEYFFHVLNT